jgi:hypothetical protein
MSDHLQTQAATGLIKSLLMASNIAFWVNFVFFLFCHQPPLFSPDTLTSKIACPQIYNTSIPLIN